MTEEPNRQPEQSGGQSVPRLYDLGAALVESRRGSIYCLTVIGQVEGHNLAPDNTKTTKYEHVLPLLAHLEQSEDVDGVLLLLNTVGGDIEAGLAIAEMVAGMTKPTVTLVLGGGHSIGIPLAVSGRQTFIVPSASMTVHPVRMSGLMIAAPQSYRYFERVQESIVSFVARHSRITQDDFRRLMLADGDMSNDVGTILYGSQAVELGLIDRIPRILGVQSTGCCPFVDADRLPEHRLVPTAENTLADSISVGVPRNPKKAQRAVYASNGAWIAVSDEDILSAMRLLGRTEGVFGEPAGVTATAGVKAAREKNLIKAGETVAVMNTGSGLKDAANAMKAAGNPILCAPSLQALENSGIMN